MQNSRLFQILYLLMAKNGMRVSELAEKTEVSTRTIRRDIDALSAAGVPIYTTRGRNGGVHLMPGFVLDKSLLSDAEQDEILYALKSISATGLQNDLLDRLEGQFGRQNVDWIDIDFSFWGAPEQQRQLFADIKESILYCRMLRFDYYGSNGKHTVRTVQPYRLCFRGMSWYLQAFCIDRQDFRVFKLSRMRDIQMQAQTFSRKGNPPSLSHGDGDIRLVSLHLRFTSAISYQVYDAFPPEAIHVLQDGCIEVRQQFPDTPWVLQFLLSFGAEVTVLAPEGLRKALVSEAKKISKLYN